MAAPSTPKSTEPRPRTVRAIKKCYLDHILRNPDDRFEWSGPPIKGVIADCGPDDDKTQRVEAIQKFELAKNPPGTTLASKMVVKDAKPTDEPVVDTTARPEPSN